MSYPKSSHFSRLTGLALILVIILSSTAAPVVLAAQAPGEIPPITPITGGLVFIPIVAKPETNLPAAPSWGSARPLTDTTIELNWNDNSTNEQGFLIFCSGLASPVTIGANVTATILGGLAASTKYNCRIASYNQVGSLMAPDLVSATTYSPADAPFAPNWLKAVTLSTSSIQLTWHNNSLGVTVCIQRSVNSGPFSDQACLKVMNTNGFYTDTGLTQATNYRYRAYVQNDIYSNIASANTFAASPPAAPSSLQISLIDSTTVHLTWQDNSPDEVDFHIEEKTGGGSFIDIASVGANTTSFNRSSRTAGTIYTYRVRAHNTYGYSGYSNQISQTTPIPLPNPPSDVAITFLAVTELDIAFTNDVNARQVNLWISVNGAPYTDEYTSELPGPPPSSLTHNELTGGTTYCYKLRSLNATGFSQFTAPVCATTYSTTLPAAPTNLAVSATSSTVALMTFDHPLTNVWGFSLSISGDGALWNEWTTVNTKTVYITNLEAGRKYYFRVRSYVMSNSTTKVYSATYSNTASVTMPGGVPGGPTTFTNTASYPIIAMTIDGVQKIPPGGAIPWGATFKLDLSAGTHTYTYTLGFLNGSTPFGMYDFNGSFSAGSTVNLRNATLAEILTHGGNYGYWVGEYWQNTIPGSMGFCFNKSGGYTFYVNGTPRSAGSAVMTSQPNPGSFIVKFSVASGPNYVATLNELDGTFMMRNGPADWPLVEYNFDGNSCP